MNEFDITLNEIKLRVYCEDYKALPIKNLMKGHSYIKEPVGVPTYTLILTENIKPKQYNLYLRMIDKWFDNASCDVWIDNYSKTVYMNNINASQQKWNDNLIQYFTCNLFNRLLEEKGFIAFHSSCVDIDGNGIAFIGPRNSGKTTCMLTLMEEGYNSVTNDKLAIKYDGNNFFGYGVAQDVSIRMSPSFRNLPQNKKYLKYVEEQNVKLYDENKLEGGNIHLESVELASINNVKQIPFTNIKNFIYPNYNSSVIDAEFKLMNKDEKLSLLQSQNLPLVHDSTYFFREVSTSSGLFYSKEELISKIIENDFYFVAQGENSRESFVNKIKILNKMHN